MSKFLMLLALFSLYCTLNAQTKPCNIQFNDGTEMNNSRILGQYKDIILVSVAENYKHIDLTKIKSITFDKGNHKWTGAAVGAAAGFITGMVLYAKYSRKDKKFILNDPAIVITMVFTFPAAIIGGLVGTFFKNRDHYDMSKMDNYKKSKELKYIRGNHYNW